MKEIANDSIELVVTSPPYPMIKMWDEMFCAFNPAIRDCLRNSAGIKAFELMHKELDKTWVEIARILKPGGIACVNIGDATRTVNSNFVLYPNHSRVVSAFQKLSISNLPNIFWKKKTNVPNKLNNHCQPVHEKLIVPHPENEFLQKWVQWLFLCLILQNQIYFLKLVPLTANVYTNNKTHKV